MFYQLIYHFCSYSCSGSQGRRFVGPSSQVPPYQQQQQPQQQQQQKQQREDISNQESGPGSGFDALGILRSMIYDPPASLEQIGENAYILLFSFI